MDRKGNAMKKNTNLYAKVLAILMTSLSIFMTTIPALAVEDTNSQVTESEEAVSEETVVIVGDCYKQIYDHDPRRNASAMADIVVNPDAVYGFSPDPKSTRLGDYASAIDWSDEEAVEKARQDRIAYLADYDNMYKKWNEMKKAGKSTEEIARTLSEMRNQIRLDSYKDDPDGLATVKASNLRTYGREEGPTPESLFDKYGSWDKVIQKCFSSNSGMDACLGLYEAQYANNLLSGTVVESETVTYTVKKGDSLAKIAARYYGNKNAWNNIYKANKSTMRDANTLHVGDEVIIPLP